MLRSLCLGLGLETFAKFLRVSVSVSKNLVSGKKSRFGFGKNWFWKKSRFRKVSSRKKVSVSLSENLVSEEKYRFRFRKNLVSGKSLDFGFGKFGIVKKVSVSVSVKILVSSFSVREVVQKRKWIFFMTFAIGRRIPYPSNSTFLLHFLPILFVLQLYLTNWLISPERGKWSKYGIFNFFFGALLWSNGLIFSSFLTSSEEILPVGF